MSRASILTFMISTAPAATGAAKRTDSRSSCGLVSRTRRWRVQSPPFSMADGTPGRGVIEPKAPPPPWNWNAVM
jgi:hypothetical protein